MVLWKEKCRVKKCDWKAELDRYLTYQRADILEGCGSTSRKSADEKVNREYKKYQDHHHEITNVDEDYFKALSRDIKRLREKMSENRSRKLNSRL